MSSSRHPFPSPHSAEVLVDVAEALWGARGLDAVSLREISLAAGLANPASVQYHFGGKDGLVWAIFSSRLPELDTRRAILMKQCASREIRALLDCLFRPLYEQRNGEGRRSYAAFLRRVLRHDDAAALRERAMSMTPSTDRLVHQIIALLPDLPEGLAAHRLVAVNLLVLDAIGQADRALPPGLSADRLYEDAIAMAAGALEAPGGS